MSGVPARPLGSPEPPVEIFLETPAFRYGLRKSTLPPWTDARFVVRTEEGTTLLEVPVADARAVNGFVLFHVPDVREGVRYDAYVAHGAGRTPLFQGAALYSLTIDDPACRALPSAPPAGDEPASP